MSDTITTALDTAGNFAELVRSAKSNSLTEYTKSTRVEPLVLIGNNLRTQTYMPDLIKNLTSVFTGYYLRAIAISMNVGRIDTIKLLDKLSTNRDVTEGALGVLSTEAFVESGLFPDYSNLELSMEAVKSRKQDFGKSGVEKTYDVPSLSLGKLIEVQIQDGEHKATIPVNVRLKVRSTTETNLVTILSSEGKDRSAKTRYKEWKAGELKFWRDLVLCQDIIDDERKMLMADSSGVMGESKRARRNNALAGILTLNPSVNNASSIMVIDHFTAKKVEREIRGKLKSFRKRNELMRKAGMMLLVIVDTEYDVITIYHNGIEGESELTVKEIMSNGNKEADVGNILAAYKDSLAPNALGRAL